MKGYIRFAERMRRPGIVFTEKQKREIEQYLKQGDKPSAQQIIYDELQMNEKNGLPIHIFRRRNG